MPSQPSGTKIAGSVQIQHVPEYCGVSHCTRKRFKQSKNVVVDVLVLVLVDVDVLVLVDVDVDVVVLVDVDVDVVVLVDVSGT